METLEMVPWVPYLETDGDTFESKLRPDTPKEIREAYEKRQREIQEYTKKGLCYPK